jgi:hypothetical protein
MDPEQIHAFTRRRPFLPFRIHVADQVHYDVPNPEWVSVGRTVVFVGVRRDPTSPYFDEPVIVALRHITRLEPLVDQVAPAVG